MRLSLSALLLSTALATGFGAGALTLLTPTVQAQDAAVATGEVDVDALLKLLPPDVKASYSGKSYDSLTGITTVRDLKLADAKNESQNFIAIQEVGLRSLDLAAFKHVFDFAAYGATPDESFKQLFGDILVKNASFNVNGKSMAAVEEIALGGVQMKQLQHKPPGAQLGAMADQAGLQFFGALLDSAITGEIKITNLTAEDGDKRFSVANLTFGGVNRGQFGASSFDTIESVEDGLVTKIASATSEGADFSKAIPWMLKAELPPVTPDPLMYFGAGAVNGISYEFAGTTLTIGSYTVDPVNFYWLVPATLKIGFNDIYFKPAAGDGSGALEGLGELGLDHLDIDAGIEWAFDGTSGGFSLKELRISESQLFDAVLNFDLTGINVAQLVQNGAGAAMQIGLTGAQLYIKNNGGFDRMLGAAAKEENTTPEALKQQALDQLTQLEGGIPGPDGNVKPLSDRVKGIVAAFKSFINSPGTLTIKVQPATPITPMTGFGALTDPIAAADALGVSVEATPQ